MKHKAVLDFCGFTKEIPIDKIELTITVALHLPLELRGIKTREINDTSHYILDFTFDRSMQYFDLTGRIIETVTYYSYKG